MLKAVFLLGEERSEAASLPGSIRRRSSKSSQRKNRHGAARDDDRPRTPEEARAARDALAKELYSRVFAWPRCTDEQPLPPIVGKLRVVSWTFLDLSPSRSTASNSCINYANERLQEKFVEIYSEASGAEYEAENVPGRPSISRRASRSQTD